MQETEEQVDCRNLEQFGSPLSPIQHNQDTEQNCKEHSLESIYNSHFSSPYHRELLAMGPTANDNYIDMTNKQVFNWKKLESQVSPLKDQDFSVIDRVVVRQMNKYFGFVKRYNSQKATIVEKVYEEKSDQVCLKIYNKETFFSFCANKCVKYYNKKTKKTEKMQIGKLFYLSKHRKEYDTIVYDPSYVQSYDCRRENPPGNVLNNYTGMRWNDETCKEVYLSSREARRGMEMFRSFIREIICWGKASFFNYLENWFALKLRKPWIKCGTMPILIGPQGSGKTLFIERMLLMFGNNADKTETSEDILGTFNNISIPLLF